MKNYHLKKEEALFLFIDIQDSLLKSTFNRKKVLENSLRLAKLVNMMKLDSLITLQYPKGLGRMTEEIHEYLKETKEIEKVSFSAMLNEEFAETLKASGKKQIVISGIETHICVLLTARDLLEAGYEVFIISDAVGSRKKANYKNGLDQLRDMGCVITNLETVLFDLNSVAGTPMFKEAQKLIM